MIANIFLFFFLIVFILLSYKKPLWGIGIVIILLPSYLWRWQIFGLPTTFLELLIVSLFLVWLIKDKNFSRINFLGKAPSANQVPPVWRWLLSLWMLASILAWLTNPTYSALGLWRAYWLEPMMFFLVMIYNVKDKNDLKFIINALGILVSWLFVLTLYQNFSSWNFIPAYNPPNVKRLTSVFSYPNALSLLTAPLTALFAGLAIVTKQRAKKWQYFIWAVLGLLMSVWAVSEGALFALFFSLFIWLILAKKIRRLTIPLVMIVLIISLWSGQLFQFGKSFVQEIINPDLSLTASSLEIRSSQWRETWLMLMDRPIFGAGLSGYQAAIGPHHQIDWIEIYLYPHNIFLNFWTELGLFGLLVFLAILIYLILSLQKLFKDKNQLAWPLIVMWLTWFVHGLVDVPYFKNDLSVLFFIMIFLTLAANKQSKLTTS